MMSHHLLPAPISTPADLVVARRAAKLTQAELAGLLGLDVRSISVLETGRTPITPSRAAHLALLFAWLDPDAT